ncbi:hypothetical protein B0A48_04233 [Cryoendolithus antarcticus]|uniref:Small ribosomal subunit protein mS38 n=1 Tax=Cryoendolithus antarcticus TaxID=1507870 RepID=A0A1V8TES1_9PEZI|nr:hypothetical protein B0A48_04233 [Cryoendolithus antarcticus]
MFSTKLQRAVQHVSPTPTPALTAHRSASQCLTSTSTRRVHQRRHSSSKASCPPESNNGKPAPAVSATEAAEDDATSESPPTPRRIPRSRARRASTLLQDGSAAFANLTAKQQAKAEELARDAQRKGPPSTVAQRRTAAKPTQAQEEPFAHLPRVDNIDQSENGKKDFLLSSFFSLYRPLNISKPVPLPTTDEAWATVFESAPQDPWANGNSAKRMPEDEIIAPEATLRLLRINTAAAQGTDLQWEVLQESSSNPDSARHLDSPPQSPSSANFDDLVAHFRPFHPPPPPQPIPSTPATLKKSRSAARAAKASQPRRPKIFRTTLDVTETKSADGQLSYTVTHTPLLPVSSHTAAQSPPAFYTPSASFLQRPNTLTYVQRLRTKQRDSSQLIAVARRDANPLRAVRKAPGVGRRVQMRLISVKRQRKLKMKKHKYKKLMKRTRNLRRRLERA